jgi:hypothetical protein
MTGGEFIAASEAAAAIAKKALGEDDKSNDLLLRLSEDTPEMRAAARSKAARMAVKQQILLKLYWPFARMLNISQAYFEDTFPQEMAAKIADIPEEHLITPSASLAVPALEGLGYSFEEPSLKELYLNLLATASDDRQTDQAHPAFADIIKQLAPRETQLLNMTLGQPNDITAARAKDLRDDPPGSFRLLISHLLPLSDETGKPMQEPQAPTWVENWQRLGLVNVTYTEFRSGTDAYAWVESRPEYLELAKRPDIKKLSFDRGLMRVTAFGRQFFRAVSE